MYRVWFTFRDSFGEDRRDFLDGNGKGLTPSGALYVAKELKAQGNRYVRIVRINSADDKEERKGWNNDV